MHPTSEFKRLSVIVTRDWIQGLWLINWFQWDTSDRLVDDGHAEYSTDLHDAREIEEICAALFAQRIPL